MIFQILLAITILASSACGLIIEIVAGRLLAPVFGMSLYTWTSIIAVVLAGLSVGHWIGGNLTRGHFVKRAQFIKIGYALFLSSLTSLLILLLLDFIPQYFANGQSKRDQRHSGVVLYSVFLAKPVCWHCVPPCHKIGD